MKRTDAMASCRTAIVVVLIVGVTFLVGCSDHLNSGGFLARSVTVGGREYNYRVFVPANRNPGKKIPVMLYLHGSGTRGDDNVAHADGFNAAISPVRDKIDFIVVLPQCRHNTFWAEASMAGYALAALDATIGEFNGDTERLYLSGFSLGGYGTWQIAAANPGKFAALVPVAGGVVGSRPIDPQDRAVIIPSVGEMLDSPEPYKEIAKAIGQTPVWVFHGALDDAVPVDFSRTIVKTLRDAGSENVKYTEYPNDGHIIVGKPFAEPGFLEWLSNQTIQKAPQPGR